MPTNNYLCKNLGHNYINIAFFLGTYIVNLLIKILTYFRDLITIESTGV
jgi:hypothetical protein